jgi:hypothetical protein
MSTNKKPKGPWVNRVAIHLLTIALTILLFWFLGFLVDDIKSIEGPQYEDIRTSHVDQLLEDEQTALQAQIDEVERQIKGKEEEQRIVTDSSENLQLTINQLIELQKLSIQKGVAFSAAEQQSLSTSLGQFLGNQKRYEELNSGISELTGEKRHFKKEMRGLVEDIAGQEEQALEEYGSLDERHDLKLAFFQLLILVPLLAVAAFCVLRKRQSIFFPLFLAFGAATIFKVTLVVHEYFPSRFFKYILIVILILAAARLLVHFIKVVAFPKAQWLSKQYQDAYRHHLCPICEYPIQIGPLKLMHWTRRTVRKLRVQDHRAVEEEAYACPSCGTSLFEECGSCNKIRHSLLPHCRHCGAETAIS